MSTSPSATVKLLRPALFLLAFALLANAGTTLYTHLTGRPADLAFSPAAFAQAGNGGPAMLGARGIYMTPAQLSPTAYGFYIFDVDSSTVSMYRVLPEANKLRFVAARSFKYDRFLEDFNNDGILPKDVQVLVEKQRQRTDLKNQTDTPSTPESPTTQPN